MTKAELIQTGIDSIQTILRTLRPEKKWTITYGLEPEPAQSQMTEFQRRMLRVLPGDEYFYVRDVETGDLLYVINVTGDSVLTALSELMDLLARKF